MTDEEKKEYEELKSLLYTGTLSQYGKRKLIEIIEKQSKEIEELKVNNKKLQDKAKELIYEKQQLTSALLDSTPNDKIKAKIEDYKKQIEKMEKDDIGRGFTLGKEWSDLKAKVEFGQSLLEKE